MGTLKRRSKWKLIPKELVFSFIEANFKTVCHVGHVVLGVIFWIWHHLNCGVKGFYIDPLIFWDDFIEEGWSVSVVTSEMLFFWLPRETTIFRPDFLKILRNFLPLLGAFPLFLEDSGLLLRLLDRSAIWTRQVASEWVFVLCLEHQFFSKAAAWIEDSKSSSSICCIDFALGLIRLVRIAALYLLEPWSSAKISVLNSIARVTAWCNVFAMSFKTSIRTLSDKSPWMKVLMRCGFSETAIVG